MTYADIMNKYRSSQAREEKLKGLIGIERGALETRVEKLKGDIAVEKETQRTVLLELEGYIASATGKGVKIGDVTAPIGQPKRTTDGYDRAAILARIVELRDGGKQSFDNIATTLNSEGFKPMSAAEFRQATVYQLYQKHHNTVSLLAAK